MELQRGADADTARHDSKTSPVIREKLQQRANVRAFGPAAVHQTTTAGAELVLNLHAATKTQSSQPLTTPQKNKWPNMDETSDATEGGGTSRPQKTTDSQRYSTVGPHNVFAFLKNTCFVLSSTELAHGGSHRVARTICLKVRHSLLVQTFSC